MEQYFSTSLRLYLLGFAFQVLVLAIFVVALGWIRKAGKFDTDKEWCAKVDSMENEFGAMALAVTWSLFVRFLISGAYSGWQGSKQPHHTYTERMLLLLYVLCVAPIG